MGEHKQEAEKLLEWAERRHATDDRVDRRPTYASMAQAQATLELAEQIGYLIDAVDRRPRG